MDHDRRRFLALTGIAATGGLAGCSGFGAPADGGADDGDAPSETPTPPATATPATEQFDFGGWFDDTDNYDGTTVDERGSDAVTVRVGAPGNEGDFAFDPPALRVDPGTTVTWEWTGEGGTHNVVHDGGEFRSGDPTDEAGHTFQRTFEADALVKYFCDPHEGLGMKGAIVVGSPAGGSESDAPAYGWQAATFDSYWYSLFNMSTNIAMSANGITFPATPDQRETFQQRVQAIAQNADVDRPPIANVNLNMAPFTEGDPHFTERPVFEDSTGRPDASTLIWDRSQSSGVVSPSSLAWTHLKGVTWAKNFEKHFETLPASLAAKFRAQVLATMAQLGTNFALIDGNLRQNDRNMLLGSAFQPGQGLVDDAVRPRHHGAMLWFLSNLTSLAANGWFGYRNPEPLIPAENIQQLTDGVAQTTMNALDPATVADAEGARGVGSMLGAVGWYGTHAGSGDLAANAATYADGLAGTLTVEGNGRVAGGSGNQAAVQGIVGQGLLWASQVDGVDHSRTAESVLGYLVDELWDADAGTFASGPDASTYTITARDAGDVTGGLNAADAVLGMSGVQDVYARFFDETFNRGRLQRAQRPVSVDSGRDDQPPVPPKAGGEFGQAAVYNAAVEYDTAAGEWSVTDDRFDTEQALYLSNQEIWISNWGGDFYQGRGVPGRSDTPP